MKIKTAHIKTIILVTLCCITFIGNAQTNVTIYPETEYQTIEGWGVSLAWWANLAGGMPQSTIDKLAGYAVNDLNFNVFRFNIGGGENPSCTAGDHFRKDGAKMPGYRDVQNNDEGWGTYNLTNDVRQITIMDKIASLRASKGDVITELVSYSPPWWMTYGECSAGNVNATSENLKPEFVDDFADYLASVASGLSTSYPSWNIQYVEPFNEPISGYWQKGGNQEGSAIYADTQAQVLWRLWQRKIAYGITGINIAAADNSKVTWALSNLTDIKENNPGEYSGVAKINTHSYGGTWQDKASLATFAKNNGNKPIWQTETGPLGWSLPSGKTDWWIRHYDMAYRLVEDMRNLKSTVWCDWQLMSIDDGWGMLHQTNWNENDPYKAPMLNKTRGFFCRKNVTNYIKVGYKIIRSDNGNTLAAISSDNTEVVMVLVNRSDNDAVYNLNLSSFSNINGFKTYRTSGGTSGLGEDTTEKTIASITEKGVFTGQILSYSAPAYSVSTFVVDIAGSLSNAEFKKHAALKIFPVPFSLETTVQFSKSINNGTFVLYDVNGKEVKRIEDVSGKTLTIKRGRLLSGIYFYRFAEKSKLLGQGSLLIN